MAWGAANEKWNHTASLMAILASIHGDPNSGRTPCPADFHPFMEPPPLPQATPELLKSLFGRVAPKGAKP